MTTYGVGHEPWVIKKGDTGKPFRAQLRDSEGPIDLTGCTVRFYMRKVGATVNAINGAVCTLVSTTTGEVRYDWQATDLNVVGEYHAEFEITLPLGDTMTVPTLRDPSRRYIAIKIIAALN